jgi:decaprenylphospho-beta-D-ribofuranose 2-oxidase
VQSRIGRLTFGILFFAAICVAVALLSPFYHPTPPIEPSGVANDFSRLHPTAVREVIRPTTEEQVRDAIQGAAAQGLKVAIAGKRHSMGGQTLFPNAIALDMLAFNKIVSLDDASKILTVQSGATWSDIQRFLNPRGLAVLSMQGPNVFTVGGSMSVNAHGWDMRHGPVASSIAWFRILLADGSVRRCSREENAELFHVVLGGYGLFGVILDVGLRVTQNFGYVADVAEMDFSQVPDYFEHQLRSDTNVELGEADLSIAPGSFLRDALAVLYIRQEGPAGLTDSLAEEQHIFRDRYFFDLSRQSSWGKSLRWALQKKLEYPVKGAVRTRNNIFRSPIERIQHYAPNDTDILQEYFVPPQNFVAFINGLRAILQKRDTNLLNATIRCVEPNQDGFLNYSRQQMFAVVLYLNIKTSTSGRAVAAQTSREIIDLVLSEGGTFYLPYVLDYDPSQLARAYPMISEFFALKKNYDPTERFSNEFYSKYSNLGRQDNVHSP